MEQLHGQMEAPSSTSETADPAVDKAPLPGLEQDIARVWADIFHLDQVGMSDNFFELGGNSLLGMDLTEMLATRLGVRVSVVTLFRNPTIREMVEAIRAEDGT